MQAIVYERYGSPDVLALKTVAQPTLKDDQVLVRVLAAGVNAADYRLLRGQPFLVRLMGYGLRKPKYPILGSDIAGRVTAVGQHVTRFKPGDDVYADLSNAGLGGFAEVVAVPESALALKPKTLSYAEAAAVPMAAITALQALRDKANLQAGQKIAINGASGGVGAFAVQLAKVFSAQVTAICSARNLEQARTLGADHVIDYTQEDFTRSGQRYAVILGINGYHPLADYRRALAPNGVYVMVGGSDAQLFQGLLLGPFYSLRGQQKFTSLTAKATADDLRFLTGLFEAGQLRPVIDRCYPLGQTADALRYAETGHARGKVVIEI